MHVVCNRNWGQQRSSKQQSHLRNHAKLDLARKVPRRCQQAGHQYCGIPVHMWISELSTTHLTASRLQAGAKWPSAFNIELRDRL